MLEGSDSYNLALNSPLDCLTKFLGLILNNRNEKSSQRDSRGTIIKVTFKQPYIHQNYKNITFSTGFPFLPSGIGHQKKRLKKIVPSQLTQLIG